MAYDPKVLPPRLMVGERRSNFGDDRPIPVREINPEIRQLRRMLAYAILHAEGAERDRRAAMELMARDPTIGTGHPAYIATSSRTFADWRLENYLLEAALDGKLEPHETKEIALDRLYRKMTEGSG